MSCCLHYLLWVLVVFFSFNNQCVGESDSISPERARWLDSIRNRSQPNLDTIVKYADPSLKGEEAYNSFLDILALREYPDPSAIHALEQILKMHIGSTRIHRYAAAQALFSINSPEAKKVLDTHLLTTDYGAWGITYAFGWEMQEPKRSNFIEQYHLRNLSDNLKVTVESNTGGNGNANIYLKVILSNISAQSFSIIKPFAGSGIYLKSRSGAFVRSFQTVTYNLPPPKFITLVPGGEYGYLVSLSPVALEDNDPTYSRLNLSSKFVLKTGGTIYDIQKPGKFMLYVLFEATPISIGDKNQWTGRAVSDPLEIVVNK